MLLYDVTRALTPRTAVFPGDTPVRITPTMQIAQGAACNVTALTLSAHAGTHVDAPRHYSDTGEGVDAISLDALIGPARVITVRAPRITIATLQSALDGAPVPLRLLIHTAASEVADEVWQDNFAPIDPDAAAWLGAQGVRLIGVDTPSVDLADSKALPAHRAFLRYGVIIVENLCLRAVPDGEYELIALPLRIVGNDAAPARVVLRRYISSSGI